MTLQLARRRARSSDIAPDPSSSGESRNRDSPELLGSGAMSELLARLRASWSVILVDSPPLGSGVDPYTLGTLTSNMLLVLRTDATDLSLARTKLSVRASDKSVASVRNT